MSSRKEKKKFRVLINTGPTRAYLDDVRYISNFSTGTLGFLLAKKFLARGAEVSVVAGPTLHKFDQLKLSDYVRVETNTEMLAAMIRLCRKHKPDWVVFSAAVLDFEPRVQRKGKHSSATAKWDVELVPTPKIIDIVKRKFPKVKRVGFKLETEIRSGRKLKEFASEILDRKQLDCLVVNFLPQIKGMKHTGFVCDQSGNVECAKDKRVLAEAIVNKVRSEIG